MSLRYAPSLDGSGEVDRGEVNTRLVAEYVELLDDCYPSELTRRQVIGEEDEDTGDTSGHASRTADRSRELHSTLRSLEREFGTAEFKAVWEHL